MGRLEGGAPGQPTLMANWRETDFQGCRAIGRLAAIFEIGPPLPEPLPFHSFKVKVVERRDGTFAAHLNVAVVGEDSMPDALAGLGSTVDEALDDALHWFWTVVQNRRAESPED